MTGVCTSIRFICFLVATLSLFTSALEANAGVRITMADDLLGEGGFGLPDVKARQNDSSRSKRGGIL